MPVSDLDLVNSARTSYERLSCGKEEFYLAEMKRLYYKDPVGYERAL